MTQSDIFDRRVRRLVYDRAARSLEADRWIIDRMIEDIIERLAAVRRQFSTALIIGHSNDRLEDALQALNIRATVIAPGSHHVSIVADEDRLPIKDNSFDLVIAINTLDTVNDLPGALILIRRALQPGGLFMAGMSSVNGPSAFKNAIRDVDASVSRFHPSIDVRAAGDLLGRAGFSLPVADNDTFTVRYVSGQRLIAELRGNGLSNTLVTRRSIGKSHYYLLQNRLLQDVSEERFTILYLTGWSPDA